MTSRKDIENLRSDKGASELARMARLLGYRSPFNQLDMGNGDGSTASDLFEFFDDNPGAVEAIFSWVLENGQDKDGNDLSDELDEVEDEDVDDEDFPCYAPPEESNEKRS